MGKYYGDILRLMCLSLWTATHRVETGIGIAVFLLLLINKPLALSLSNWEGVSPRWAFLPLALVFGHYFLKAIYHKHHTMEEAKDKALTDSEAAWKLKVAEIQTEHSRKLDEVTARYEQLSGEHKTMSQQVAELKTGTEDRAKRRATLDLLGTYLAVADRLEREAYRLEAEEDYRKWSAAFQQWVADVKEALRNGFNNAVAVSFETTFTVPRKQFSLSSSIYCFSCLPNELHMLTNYKHNMQVLIGKFTE